MCIQTTVTDEMIEAGAIALLGYWPGEESADEFAKEIYLAMIGAERQREPSGGDSGQSTR